MKLNRIGLRFGIILTLTSLSLLLFVSSAKADGRELLGRCTLAEKHANGEISKENVGADDAMSIGYCLGYIAGIVGLNAIHRTEKLDFIFCNPHHELTNEQGMRIVMNYLRQHPENLHFAKATLVFSAFTEAFPCKP